MATLNKLNPGPFVELHPEDAKTLGIADRDRIEVKSRRGRAVLPAVVTDRVRSGNCFAPFHWNDVFGEALAINAVTSDAVDPVLALHNLMHFYKHESCGKCTPCREGCGWVERIVEKIVEGKGSMDELDQISEIASNIMGNTICAFGDGAAQPMLAFVRKLSLIHI